MSNKKELQSESTSDVDNQYIIHNSYGEAWSVETGCWVNFEQATQMSCGEASAMLMLWGRPDGSRMCQVLD
jgi:hypothetical protein